MSCTFAAILAFALLVSSRQNVMAMDEQMCMTRQIDIVNAYFHCYDEATINSTASNSDKSPEKRAKTCRRKLRRNLKALRKDEACTNNEKPKKIASMATQCAKGTSTTPFSTTFAKCQTTVAEMYASSNLGKEQGQVVDPETQSSESVEMVTPEALRHSTYGCDETLEFICADGRMVGPDTSKEDCPPLACADGSQAHPFSEFLAVSENTPVVTTPVDPETQSPEDSVEIVTPEALRHFAYECNETLDYICTDGEKVGPDTTQEDCPPLPCADGSQAVLLLAVSEKPPMAITHGVDPNTQSPDDSVEMVTPEALRHFAYDCDDTMEYICRDGEKVGPDHSKENCPPRACTDGSQPKPFVEYLTVSENTPIATTVEQNGNTRGLRGASSRQ